MSQQCSAKNRNGKRCGAWAVAQGSKCALHLDPERASKLGSKSKRRTALPPSQSPVPIEMPRTAADVRNALANTMVQVHARTMDAKTANTLAYVATSLLHAIEISDQESRLVAIEEDQRRVERALFPSITTEDTRTNGE